MMFDPEKVRELREARKLSREELAVRSGIPYGTLTSIELGYTEAKAGAVTKIAAALGVDLPPELFSDREIQVGRPAGAGR